MFSLIIDRHFPYTLLAWSTKAYLRKNEDLHILQYDSGFSLEIYLILHVVIQNISAFIMIRI